MALFGAAIGPVALAWGLQRTRGTGASLMLTLQAVFTAALARLCYREAMGRRVAVVMALLTAGGMALVLDRAGSGTAPMQGLLAVVLATACWGVDNTLSPAVAGRDPGQVVMFNGALGAIATTGLAWALREPLPSQWQAAALLSVGATGYGLSLRLYLLAQRTFGAVRTGFRVRLRALPRRGPGLRAGRTRRQPADARCRGPDGRRHRSAPGRASRARTCP